MKNTPDAWCTGKAIGLLSKSRFDFAGAGGRQMIFAVGEGEVTNSKSDDNALAVASARAWPCRTKRVEWWATSTVTRRKNRSKRPDPFDTVIA